MEIIIIKRIRRFLNKKKVANILSSLIEIVDTLHKKAITFLPRTELNLIQHYKEQLYKYYPRQFIEYNWVHTITLRDAFYQLGVWEAW